MKRQVLVWLSFLLLSLPVLGQKVGLVLSGGGAKGIAHIGIIQALEDNGIPIDYVAGTSIGAVVGGLYAMGLSPAEMMALIKSEEFENWKNGTVENQYMDFFRRPDPKPDFLTTAISLKDSVIDPKKLLPTSLLDPIQLNIAFLQLTAQATAQCGGDFDRLFIPLRTVASDVNNRRMHVFRKGDVGDAIRTSMSFPFVFKAIRVEGMLLYDGGIYNNYPVDVMDKDFKPDVIIGSVVSELGKKEPDDNDLVGQLQNMIIRPGNDTLPQGKKGLQLDFDLSSVSLLAFHKADSVYRLGYEKTMEHMDEIKAMVQRRVDPFTCALKRSMFRNSFPQMRFREIEIKGVNETQRDYIFKVLKQDGTRYFSFEQLKEGYFKLLMESKIKEIRPEAVYNPADDAFKLILNVELDESINISIGANLTSTSANHLYIGADYEALNEYAQIYSLDAYMGRIQNAIDLNFRFHFNGSQKPQYFSMQFGALNYNYFESEQLFYQEFSPAFIRQYESYLKLRYAFPLLKNGKMEVGTGGAFLLDSYMQKIPKNFTSESFDRSTYGFGSFSARFEQNTLDKKQLATNGTKWFLNAQYLTGEESYRYPDSVGRLYKIDRDLDYVQLSGGFEHYKSYRKNFILGTKGEFVFNNKRPLDNYTSSVIQAPAFTPTPHSMIRFNEGFRSNQYLALGVLPIWKFNERLHLRTECYGFFPWSGYRRGSNQEAIPERSWSHVEYLAETALVYYLPITNISLYLNHYSYPSRDWNFGINIGYLIFARKFIE